MGFYVLPDGGYGHGGGAAGINGELHILPHSGYVLVALANRDPRTATNMVDFMTSILPVHYLDSNNHSLHGLQKLREPTTLTSRESKCLCRNSVRA